MQPLAILGATGLVGGLVVELAREAGLPLRLVGRRRDALQALVRSGEEVRVADARDPAALRAAFDGTFAVASTAGPFLELGTQPIAAALDAGAHYVDTAAEQAFVRAVYDRFGDRKAETVAVPSFGFDFAVGDFAARLAADGLEPLDEVVVAYSTRGFIPSAGTRRTMADVMTQPQVAYENGRTVESRFGATTRRIRFSSGESTAVEWAGAEPLTVPRHTDVRNVRSYVRAPAIAARTARLARMAAPLVRAAGRVGDPSRERLRKARFELVAEARGAAGARRATVSGRDIYGLAALMVVRGVEALRDERARATGVVAPAEAFDARPFLERLSPLVEAVSVDPL